MIRLHFYFIHPKHGRMGMGGELFHTPKECVDFLTDSTKMQRYYDPEKHPDTRMEIVTPDSTLDPYALELIQELIDRISTMKKSKHKRDISEAMENADSDFR